MSKLTTTNLRPGFSKQVSLRIVFLAILTGATILCNLHVMAQNTAPVHQSEYVQDQLIISFKEGIIPVYKEQRGNVEFGVQGIDKLTEKYRCVSVRQLNKVRKGSRQAYTYVLKFDMPVNMPQVVKEFEATGSVRYAEPDYIDKVDLTTPNDPYFSTSWALHNDGTFPYSTAGADMDMKRAWDITQGSSAITVAVIDAGAKMDHPEFAGRIWINPGEIVGNGIDDDGNGYIDDYRGWNFVSNNNNPTDDHSHGTNVAGIIGAKGNNAIGLAGVDWNCKLMILKPMNSGGAGSHSHIIESIYYATDNGANVINMSLGGNTYSSAMEDATEYAHTNNVTVVAAMGNNSTDIPFYPAAYASVIAVGASNASDQLASFSNFGNHMSVVAPGVSIYGLWYLSNTDYSHAMSGTSMAAPMVAGVISLLLAQDPTRTPDQLRTLIESSAEDMVGFPWEDVPGFDEFHGHGRVNAYNALTTCLTPSIDPISGPSNVCAGATISLTNTTTAGSWSSSNTLVATINTSGYVTGLTGGTTVITYSKTNSCGVGFQTKTVTVMPLNAGTISGSTTINSGVTSTLSSNVPGGAWISANTAIATINPTSGSITGFAEGSTTIFYAVTNSCGSFTTSVNVIVTCIFSPGITGPNTVCEGANVNLIMPAPGGTWSSSNPGAATVGSASGLVTGINNGMAVISYSLGACALTHTVTVTPGAGTLSGASSLCAGTTTTFSSTVGGGTWSSSNSAIASIGAASGIAAGISGGVATISYIVGSCFASKAVSVEALPSFGSTPGIITTIGGDGTPGFAGDGGPLSGAKFNTPADLFRDHAGNMYVSDNINNRVRKISTSGIITTVAGTGTTAYNGDGIPATAANINEPLQIGEDSHGNIYFADRYNYRIRKINTAGIISTIAGTGIGGFSGDGGQATAAKINQPIGLVIDAGDNIYFTDLLNHRIRKITNAGIISTIAGNGSNGYSGHNVPATTAALSYPSFLFLDGSGNLIFSDSYNNRIRKIVLSTGIISNYAGTGTTGFSGDGGPATAAMLWSPHGITSDNAGNIIFADRGTSHIRKISPTGIISSIAGTGTHGYSGDGGPATSANMDLPMDIEFDNNGDLVITDNLNDVIRKITFSGSGTTPVTTPVTMCAGASTQLDPLATGGIWSSTNTAAATVGTAGLVTGVASGTSLVSYTLTNSCGSAALVYTVTVTPGAGTISGSSTLCAGTTITLSPSAGSGTWSSSNIFIASVGAASGIVAGINGGDVIISYTVGSCFATKVITVNEMPTFGGDPGIITTIGGDGTPGFAGDGGPLSGAKFNTPADLFKDHAGNMYVSDNLNDRVRKISTSGIITTVAGTGIAAYNGDGIPATAAQINEPLQIGEDSHGNIYFADRYNYRIRKISTTGIITTIAGTGLGGFSGDGGQATAANINQPIGLVIDAADNIYFTDLINHRIRKITNAGIISTIAGNGSNGYSGHNVPATTAALSYPSFLFLDGSGNLIFSDSYNNRIRKIVLSTGIISNYAGTGTTGFSGDGGPATAAMLWSPHGITSDNAGNIIFADRGTSHIRKISPAGIISSIAGTGTHGYSGDGGPATSANMDLPMDIEFDINGDLVITDNLNDVLRKITISGSGTTPVTTPLTMCAGASTQLDQLVTGGIWSSTNTAAATVGTAGLVTGIASGTSMVSYTLTNSCGSAALVYTVTVTTGAGTISGLSIISIGTTTSFSSTTAGGTWSTSNNTVATIGGSTGIAVGLSGGTTRISYLMPGGCFSTTVLTVTGTPAVTSTTIVTIAGDGTAGYSGDGGQASSSRIKTPGYVVTAPDGSIYFSDYGNSRIRKIDPSGIISTVAGSGIVGFSGDGGPATAAQMNNANGIALDGAGNLYIADYDNNRIRRVNTSGTISTIAGNGSPSSTGDGGPAAVATIYRPYGLTIDAAGNLYVAEHYGHRIRKIAVGTGMITTVAGTGVIGYSGDNGPATSAKIEYPNFILAHTDGNLYITDNGNQRIRKVTPAGIISTVAGNGTLGFSGDGGQATAAKLSFPTGVKIDPSGNMYITDHVNHRIRVVNTSGIITTIAGTGINGYNSDCRAPETADLNLPIDIAFDNDNNLIIADFTNNRLRKIKLATLISGSAAVCTGSTTALSASTGGGTWSSSNTSVATVGSSTGLVGGVVAGTATIAFIKAGDCATSVVVTVSPGPGAITGAETPVASGASVTLSCATTGGTWSSSNNAVATIGAATGIALGISSGTTVITYAMPGGCYITAVLTVTEAPATKIIVTIAGDGTAGYSGDNGHALLSKLNKPVGLIADAAGNLYFCDQSNGVVRKINTAGVITTIAGYGVGGFGGDGGPATAAELNEPNALALDASGNLYISDCPNHRVRKVSPAGIITTYAGTGVAASSGDGGPASAAAINRPFGLIFDPAGNLYVADLYGHRVRKITPAGIISTVAGTGASGYSGDGGPATTAKLSYPNFLGIDASGNLLITDNGNHRIRKVNAAGVITTIAGNGTIGFSGDGGPATAAQFEFPAGLKLDATGNLYIADAYNDKIRKVDTSGIISTIVGTGTAGYNGDCRAPETAHLNKPHDVLFADNGDMIFTDMFNNRIRKITNGISTSGTAIVCVGSSTPLAASAGGGLWSSSNTSVATVGSSTGLVVGIAAGTATISYTAGSICSATIVITVSPVPGAIAGAETPITSGATVTLSCTTAGGTWSSSNVAVATIGTATGIALGISAGTTFITYAMPGGCLTTTTLTVNSVPSTTTIITIAGDGTAGYSGDNGPALSAKINQPIAMITDATGNIFFCDNANAVVRKINTAGIITTIAGSGVAGDAGDGGPATAAQLNNPVGLVFDAVGNFYIADALSNKIRKVSPSGMISTFAGTGADTSSGDGGPATAADLKSPYGLVFDTSGNLFVVELYGHKIRKINTTTGIITTVAGIGTVGNTGDGGPATAAALSFPNFLNMDATGNLIVTDNGNHRIRMINSAGIITNIAGSGSVGFSGDGGPATAAKLRYPAGVCVDAAGNLYIADAYNNRIRKVSSSGIISTVVGTGIADFNGDCRAPETAEIDKPHDIIFAANGDMIFTDRLNHRIRRITNNISISGSAAVCVGSATTLTASAGAGSWSSSNNTVATVGSATGVVEGLVAGTATIYYSLGTGCGTSIVVTVLAVPSAITGTLSTCPGATTTLSTTSTGGTWSSSDPAVATISTDGIVSGLTNGTATISYTVTAGCATYATVTVGLATSNSGEALLCLGQPIAVALLSNSVPGGTWSSSNTARVTINMLTGAMNGVSTGTANITYMVDGCHSISEATVNAAVAEITGTTNVCPGTNVTLSNITVPGSWSSSNADLAIVNSSTGAVTGISAGTVIMTYMVTEGCYATRSLLVYPAPASIAGDPALCPGSTTVLSCVPAGGTWTSTNTAQATIHPTSGIATGVTAGTAHISYHVAGTGCVATREITVNTLPSAISGMAVACIGSATTLTATPAGGTWTSSNTARATADAATGAITGITAGTGTISYVVANNCYSVRSVTINPVPAAITGTAAVCEGNVTGLLASPAGGVWSSSNNTTATVAAGSVRGISNGIVNISYQLATGCFRIREVTVNTTPAAISGTNSVCIGNTTTLNASPAGGLWNSSTPARASVNSAGEVNGISAGTAIITYTIGSCYKTTIVTVNALPAAITGTATVCEGLTTTFSCTPGGGTWSSSNATVATNLAGVIRGVAMGTATITYQLATGCSRTRNVTVNTTPSAITGTLAVCTGSSTTLNATPAGGVWSSSTVSRATVGGATGIVNAISVGTVRMSYTIGSCYSTALATVNVTPSAMTGTPAVCEGGITSFATTPAGGTWSSSSIAVATVSAGTIRGINSGTATITYMLTTGCSRTRDVTVNSTPDAIGGTTSVCIGNTTTLNTTPAGGTWSSNLPAKAAIHSTNGTVTGISAGTANITYNLNGCIATRLVTVNSLPTAIGGPASICATNTTTLSATPAGGIWSSSHTDIATLSGAGITAGVDEGVATITYELPTGCITTRNITVNPVPAANTGDAQLCTGQAIGVILLANAVPGGTWSSSNTARIVTTTAGSMKGMSTGTANITYKLGSGCYSITEVTVNSAVPGITGTASICAGTTVSLANTTGSGSWTSSNIAKATIDAISGDITALSAGTTTITYMISPGCYSTRTQTVLAGPSAITGAASVVALASTTLSSSPAGGTWSSSNTAAATIMATTGIARGIAPGAATVSYTLSTGCRATHELTVVSAKPDLADAGTGAHFSVYPNPSTGALTIKSTQPGIFTIYTIDGRQVDQHIITNPSTAVALPYNLAAGMYMCRFVGDDGTLETVRLVYKP